MKKHYYGGQAVLEGVMMRGRKTLAVAVRNPQGEIVVHTEPLTAKIYTADWGSWPFVRGLAQLWDALGLGMRALMWSAEVSAQEEDGEKVEFSGPVAWTTIAGSLVFAVALFMLLPTFIGRFTASTFFNGNRFADAAVESIVQLTLFIAYLWAIGRLPDIARVFGYHGAEHKTINAYEAGAPLTVEAVRRHSVQHVRCGTSFLLYLMLISIVLFAPLTFTNFEPAWLGLLLRIGSRLILIPLVAGIAYEILRFSAAHAQNPIMKVVMAPGLALQRLTTREPDDAMLECAIVALEPVLAADGIPVQSQIPSTRRSDVLPAPGLAPAAD
jgi:uncharacterized protein YqhQ